MGPVLHEQDICAVYDGDLNGGQEVCRAAALLRRRLRQFRRERDWGGHDDVALQEVCVQLYRPPAVSRRILHSAATYTGNVFVTSFSLSAL